MNFINKNGRGFLIYNSKNILVSKVTFDGVNKLIIIHTGVTDINVRDDIYIPWKSWVIENPMFLQAIRTFGGDPTTLNQNTPTYYFLTNNWMVKAENINVVIHENLYSDDVTNPYININSTILSKNSDIPSIDTLTGITNSLSDIENSLINIEFDIKHILGLTQQNYRLSNHVYDSENRLTSVDIKIYLTKSDCNNQTNEFATYSMNATYNSSGLLTDYKVVKN